VRKFDHDCGQFKQFEGSRSLQGSRRKNAVPPTIEEVHELGTGRGVKVKP